jgi:hypothetical protein
MSVDISGIPNGNYYLVSRANYTRLRSAERFEGLPVESHRPRAHARASTERDPQ